jgi:hypothetical protein
MAFFIFRSALDRRLAVTWQDSVVVVTTGVRLRENIRDTTTRNKTPKKTTVTENKNVGEVIIKSLMIFQFISRTICPTVERSSSC